MKFTLILISLILSSCTHHHNNSASVYNQYNNYPNFNPDPIFKSVAQVIVKVEKDSRAMGTGFAIRNINNNTYFVTVHHLCERRGKKALVRPVPNKNNAREEYEGRVVYSNKEDDVCVIRAYKTGKQFLPLKFSEEPLTAGTKIYTIGAPNGVFPTKTDGYIVGHDLLGYDGADEEGVTKKLLVTSVPADRGNSGGPVYNQKYEVVGMIAASHTTYPHSSLAIHVESISKHLKTYFKRDLNKK